MKVNAKTYSMNLEKVLKVIQENPGGVKTKTVTETTGFSFQKAVHLLNKLTKEEKIVRVETERYGLITWKMPFDNEFLGKEGPLYPEFDKEHEQWRKKVLEKKPVYNPR